MFFRWFCLLIVLYWNTTFAEPAMQVSKESQFISIADLHFDPFQGCAQLSFPCPLIVALKDANSDNWGAIFEKYQTKPVLLYRKNTNYPLLKSTFHELKTLNKEMTPSFVLVLGDFLAHDYRRYYKKYTGDKSREGYIAFVKKTMEYLTYELNQTFPKVDVYPVVGNNDSYTGDYSVVPQGMFLRDLTSLWSSLIKDQKNRQSFEQNFSDGGFYTVKIGPKARIMVLNTVLFSPYSQTPLVRKMAEQQLSWFRQQLALAAQEKESVFIALHIPGAVDVTMSMIASYQIFKRFWREEYVKTVTKTMRDFPGTVAAIFPGHVHIDMFPFFISVSHDKKIPMLITPSVSPIYGNNPAVKVFYYEENSLRVEHFDRYYLPAHLSSLDEWRKGNRFNSVYYQDCHYCYFGYVIRYLTSNNNVFNFFQKYYSGVDDTQSYENDWMLYYWCSIYHRDIKSYKACLTE